MPSTLPARPRRNSHIKGMDVHAFGCPQRVDYSTHAPKANTCLVTRETFSVPFSLALYFLSVTWHDNNIILPMHNHG
ncbi:hypothetical protein SODG_002288 [Sodalis praecaptivus]